MTGPLILLTNDDGVSAPGLQALRTALLPLGAVHVVAPDREVSACSHGLTRRALRAERVGEASYAVDGTPADCVSLAVLELLHTRPALVVSGINFGANLADDVFYSGTVAGAREAVFHGIPAIAVSLASKSVAEFGDAAGVAARLAALVLEQGLPPRTLLNVNVPPGPVRGALVTRQGRHERNGGGRAEAAVASEAPADLKVVRDGLVSITPLHTDTTHHAALAVLRGLEGRFTLR
jgi:5'-nucleotidase